jgi:hypothetical protein
VVSEPTPPTSPWAAFSDEQLFMLSSAVEIYDPEVSVLRHAEWRELVDGLWGELDRRGMLTPNPSAEGR